MMYAAWSCILRVAMFGSTAIVIDIFVKVEHDGVYESDEPEEKQHRADTQLHQLLLKKREF